MRSLAVNTSPCARVGLGRAQAAQRGAEEGVLLLHQFQALPDGSVVVGGSLAGGLTDQGELVGTPARVQFDIDGARAMGMGSPQCLRNWPCKWQANQFRHIGDPGGADLELIPGELRPGDAQVSRWP